MRIGLLSDTHGWLHPSIAGYFSDCDEIWHAGDIGSIDVADSLEKLAPLRAVSGNIDDPGIRARFPVKNGFAVSGCKVLITHIGGYPGKYSKDAYKTILKEQPDIFICGHSHIARVEMDKRHGLLFINPGAAGRSGFHQVMTIARFNIQDGRPGGFELIELGTRT